MKNIIFLLVDSLIPAVLDRGLKGKKVPGLQFLVENGLYKKDCVTVFPTMTASIDASLITGVYPDQHKIPGLLWYDPKNKEIINYVNGGKCIRKLGIKNCARNVLFHLNEKHLSKQVTTVFEECDKLGKSSASVNLIIHRGRQKHTLSLPSLVNSWLGDKEVAGPDILTLGAMAYPSNLKDKVKSFSTSFKKLYGINDDFAISVTQELIRNNKQPKATFIYLPDNDHTVHKTGPKQGEWPLIQVDRQIQKLLNTFSSWEEALEKNIFVITSDHGQTPIGKESEYNIDLDHLFHSLRVLQLTDTVTNNHELVICNNERMAYLYPLKENVPNQLFALLKTEPRIDIIAWKEEDMVHVSTGKNTLEKVVFKRGGSSYDPYGQSWTIEGDLSILDIQIKENLILYQDYPDVLARLYGALFSQEFPMFVITARPGFEFITKYFPKHNNGGSHGSLYKDDSFVPIITAGDDNKFILPERIVEIKDYLLKLVKSQSKKEGS